MQNSRKRKKNYNYSSPNHRKRNPNPNNNVTNPYPSYLRPTPEECRIVRDTLLTLDGFPEEFAKYRSRNPKIVTKSEGFDGELDCFISETPTLSSVSVFEKETVLDGLVEILLSQNTTDLNSKRAFASLKLAFLTWEDVLAADTKYIENAIRCGGLAVTKASCIKNLLSGLLEKRGKLCLEYLRDMSIDEIKAELRGFKGIGPKTVACLLMFHLQFDDFPVDTHVFRITKFMGWVPADADREKTYLHLNKRIPDELKFDLNCLLVTHGKICLTCSKKLTDQNSKSSNASCPLSKAVQMAVQMTTGYKSKFKDNPFMKMAFIEKCIREVKSDNNLGTSLKPISWKRIENEINEEFHQRYKQKDLKNQFDYLRKSYETWRMLTNRTEHGYDAVSGTFNWPQSTWDDIVKQYPSAKKFQTRPLQYAEKLKQLFEGTFVNRYVACGPEKSYFSIPDEEPSTDSIDVDTPQTFDPTANHIDVDPPQTFDPTANTNDVDLPQTFDPRADSIDVHPPQTFEPFMDEYTDGVSIDIPSQEYVTSTPSTDHNEHVATSHGAERQRRSVPSDDRQNEVRDLIGLIREQLRREQVEKEPSVEDCIKLLNELMGPYGKHLSVYLKAVKAFCDCPAYIRAFMAIPTPELKMGFVDTITKAML
ncbi:hypothetical protein GIB67_032921 [Kingdonia uniflora]|uniref:HhH-GPD domain-containing protein n=1 Tax=Kingdonia uniflora TaxID=39325 RepID=A0A7J7MYB2_9MAGN|nr:hypothetical protein GIB67_032921 [Kingdonia uniflora]